VNNKGNPWTDTAWGKAMSGLRRKLAAAGVTLASTGIMYGFRHAFATEMLKKGVPEAHVAGMLGHKSTAMLSKHYSHLSSEYGTFMGHLQHLPAMAGEAAGSGSPPAAAAALDSDETTGQPLEGPAA
jgi:site-specific recombinase XerD